MKHRNIMAVIFFSIITLGIYDLFWLVSVKKELNAKTKVHTPTLWLLFAPVLLLLACYIFLIVSLAHASGSQSGHPSAGVSIAALLIGVVAVFLVLPITFYWFIKFSKAINEYTQGAMSTAVTFLLLYLLRFIGMALIQDHFNDMMDGNIAIGQPTPAPQPVAAPLTQPTVQPVAPQVEPLPQTPETPVVEVTPSAPVEIPQQPTEPVGPEPPQPPMPPAAA